MEKETGLPDSLLCKRKPGSQRKIPKVADAIPIDAVSISKGFGKSHRSLMVTVYKRTVLLSSTFCLYLSILLYIHILYNFVSGFHNRPTSSGNQIDISVWFSIQKCMILSEMSGVYPIIKSSGFLSIFPSVGFFLRGSWISFPVLAGHFETYFLTKRKRAFIMAFIHNFFVLKRAIFAIYKGIHLGNGGSKELKGIESRMRAGWKKRNWSLRKTERLGKERIKLFGKTSSKHRISCCFLCSVPASLFLNLLNGK